MSVIVKGLDLPAYKEGYKNRYVCLLVLNPDGTTDLYVADKKYPVSTIPTPHGRLIDADELEKCVHEWYDVGEYVFADTIRNTDTIIEAEVSE